MELSLYIFLKIKIIAQIGKKGYSDIAIDDVYIDSGLCCKYNTDRLSRFFLVGG